MNAPYTKLQIWLHWLIFLAIAVQFIAHEPMSDAWDKVEHGGEIAFDPLVFSHVALGGLIFLLVLVRIVARFRFGAPELPAEEPPMLRMLAALTHLVLYALMILMPVSGAVAWFGGVEAAGEAHEVMKALMLIFVGLHVVGALFHQFVLKTNIMERMKRPGGVV